MIVKFSFNLLLIRGRDGLWSVLKVNIADTFIIIAFTTA